MRRLFFLRHGRADRAAWHGPDRDRPLTPEGADRMRREAASVRDLDLGIDLVLSSPLTRARQTAEIVAAALPVPLPVEIDARLGPSFGRDALAAILADRPAGRRILLVGHEPGFSETVGALTGGRVACRKGSLVRVDLEDEASLRGVLVWSLPAGLLVR